MYPPTHLYHVIQIQVLWQSIDSATIPFLINLFRSLKKSNLVLIFVNNMFRKGFASPKKKCSFWCFFPHCLLSIMKTHFCLNCFCSSLKFLSFSSFIELYGCSLMVSRLHSRSPQIKLAFFMINVKLFKVITEKKFYLQFQTINI